MAEFIHTEITEPLIATVGQKHSAVSASHSISRGWEETLACFRLVSAQRGQISVLGKI